MTSDRHGAVDFLRHVLRHIAGTVIEGKGLVIWDGLPAPRLRKAEDVRSEAVRSETGERVHLGQRPGYAPDVSPEEGIWRYLKKGDLKKRALRANRDAETAASPGL